MGTLFLNHGKIFVFFLMSFTPCSRWFNRYSTFLLRPILVFCYISLDLNAIYCIYIYVLYIYIYPKMGDPQVTIRFNTNMV